jgi:hypothetical protein
MPLIENTAEGGSNGSTVTTGNSGGGSGTAFTSVSGTAGTATTFDAAQAAHGALSYHFTGPVSTLRQVTLNGGSATSYAARCYIRYNTLAGRAHLRVGPGMGFTFSANVFTIVNALGATIKTFATTLTTGVWYRLEVEAAKGTTTSNGYIAGRYFLGDVTTPAETAYSSNTVNADTVAYSGDVLFGMVNTGTAFDFWMDDLAINAGTTTPIGPYVPATPAFAGWGIPL